MLIFSLCWKHEEGGSSISEGMLQYQGRLTCQQEWWQASTCKFPSSLSFDLCCNQKVVLPATYNRIKKVPHGNNEPFALWLIPDSVMLTTNCSNLYQWLEVMSIWASNYSRQKKINQEKKFHVSLPGEVFHMVFIYIWSFCQVESGMKIGTFGV